MRSHLPTSSIRRGLLATLSALVLVAAPLAIAGPAVAAGHGNGGGGGGGKPGGGGGGGSGSLSVTNPGMQMATVGNSVGSLQIQVSGAGNGTLSFSDVISSTGGPIDSLPPGLTIDSATGTISGTATAVQQYWVTITVTDTAKNGSTSTASTAFWWFVNAGYDISWPQCPSTFPQAGQVSVVGVTDGSLYTTNPCLGGTSGELSWADGTAAPALYLNTGDPGPKSSNWPVSSSTAMATANGHTCEDSTSNSTDCSYVYGWKAAADAWSRAISAGATASYPWWLDVETGNAWETLDAPYSHQSTSPDNDLAALRGMADYLASQGVTVGIYASSTGWDEVTGGPSNSATSASGTGFPSGATPTWVPHTTSYTQGFTYGCTAATNFLTGTSGGISMYQYTVTINGTTFDADYVC